MNKFKKIFLLVLLIFVLFIVVIFNINNRFYFKEVNMKKIENNYSMQISYPIFNRQNKINKEIKKYIKQERKSFLNKIKNNNYKSNELNINYSYTKKNNIYSFHIRAYSVIGDNNMYYRNDKIYYFDKDKNEDIALNSLISDDSIYYIFRENVINNLKYIENLYNENKLDKNLEVNKDNYKLIMFNTDYIQIILEPYKVSSAKRETIVNISYKDVIKYLSNEYFSDLNNAEEMVKKEREPIRDKRLFNGKKLVALTFDDGPSYDKTKRLIDELDKRNARVSFFMLGEQAIKQEKLVKDIYIRGHTIGSHTYDHKQLTKLKMNEVIYEINYTNEIIKNITGEDVKYLRPPYGSYTKEMLDKINMSFILWNVDVEDWKLKNSKKIFEYIVNNVNDGDIVLVHDIHDETIEGVLMAIDELQKRDFAFVSIDELSKFKNINVELHKAYRYFK